MSRISRTLVVLGALVAFAGFVSGPAALADGVQPGKTLTEFWNGSAWKLVASPNVGSQDELRGVAAVSGNNVYAVGFHQSPSTGR